MDKYNLEEEVKNCKESKNPFASLRKVNHVQIKSPSDATKVLYHGDLDKYFNDVKECIMGNQFIDVLYDMYEEIKQLRSIIDSNENKIEEG